MESYNLERWSNQPYYVEVWIEKKALQGVFEKPCLQTSVGLGPCKGYPSLTFLNEAVARFSGAEDRGQEIIILYFGDFDPSGVDIPRSINDNIKRLDFHDCRVDVIALHAEQIEKYNLPPYPAKSTDSRAKNWEGGTVELDAMDPHELQKICRDAIMSYLDIDLHNELMERQDEEQIKYQTELFKFVKNMSDKK